MTVRPRHFMTKFHSKRQIIVLWMFDVPEGGILEGGGSIGDERSRESIWHTGADQTAGSLIAQLKRWGDD
jgi:hypothetical protein